MEERQKRQLRALMISLEAMDYGVTNGSLIFKTGTTGIYYSKINGNVALRPRCCLGPELTRDENDALRATGTVVPESAMTSAGKGEIVTYLERVHKKDGRESPLLKESSAPERMKEIEEDRTRRRLVIMHR